MNATRRFHEARLFIGAGTIALLLGLWSALTVHDIQARTDEVAVVPDSTTAGSASEAAPAMSSQSPATTTTSNRTNTTPAPHTRTRAS